MMVIESLHMYKHEQAYQRLVTKDLLMHIHSSVTSNKDEINQYLIEYENVLENHTNGRMLN